MRNQAHRMAGNEEQRRALKMHRRKYGINDRAQQRLLAALGTLADYGPIIDQALHDRHQHAIGSIHDVCAGIKVLVDGPRDR